MFFSHLGQMAAAEMTAAEPAVEAAEMEAAAAAGEDVSDADRTAHAGTAVVAWRRSYAVNEDPSDDGVATAAADDDDTAEGETCWMTLLSVGWPALQLDLRHGGMETRTVREEQGEGVLGENSFEYLLSTVRAYDNEWWWIRKRGASMTSPRYLNHQVYTT